MSCFYNPVQPLQTNIILPLQWRHLKSSFIFVVILSVFFIDENTQRCSFLNICPWCHYANTDVCLLKDMSLSACVSKWLVVFWFVLFLKSRAQLLAALHPSGLRLAQWGVVPASVRELPAVHLLFQARHVLSVRPEPNTTKPWTDLSDSCGPSVKVSVCPLWPYTKTRVSCHSLCSGLKSSPVLPQVTPGCYPLPPCCAHTQIHTRAHTHTLWRTGINTITIVPISCPCCHYAAAEWDMVEFPSVKENQTCTHIHISWPNNSCHLSLSLSLFAWFKTQTHICACARTHTHRCQNSLA